MADPKTTEVIITSILTTLGVNGIIGAPVLLWLKHSAEKKLEAHKSELKTKSETTIETLRADLRSQSDREMERFRNQATQEVEHLRSNLQTVAAQNNFRFSKVFERTETVIATTYAKLLTVQDAVSAYTQTIEPEGDPDRKQAGEELRKAQREFAVYYLPNKIYVPKTTQRKIQALFNTALRLASNFTMAEVAMKNKSNFETFEELSINVEKLQQEVPNLLEAMEDDFQKLLGFPESKPEKPDALPKSGSPALLVNVKPSRS